MSLVCSHQLICYHGDKYQCRKVYPKGRITQAFDVTGNAFAISKLHMGYPQPFCAGRISVIKYRKVILPLTVLRRFDCLLARTKQAVLEQYKTIKTKPQTVINSLMQKTTGYPFYNLSKLDFPKFAG